MRLSDPRLLAVLFAACAALVLAARLLGFGEGALLGATPASGVALFAAVLRRWQGGLAAGSGFVLGDLVAGLSPALALFDGGAHGLAAVAGALAMRGLARRRPARSRTSDWLVLLVGVGAFTTVIAGAAFAAAAAGLPVAGALPPWSAAALAAAFEPLGLFVAGAAIASAGEIGRIGEDLRPTLATAALGAALLAALWLVLPLAPVSHMKPGALVLMLATPFCLWIAMQGRSLDGAVLSLVASQAALAMLLDAVGGVGNADFVTTIVRLTLLVGACQLVHAVNRDRLAALAEVEARKRDLEARVAERTARLAAMTERALASDAAKTRFLATVSHEVRTPLTGVLGMATLVLADDGLDARARQNVEVIRTSGAHLLDVINRLLDFTRMEQRRGEQDEAVFDVAVVLEEVLAEARFLPYAAGLRLQAEVAPDLALLRRGSRIGLRQILTNLVGNAAKFTAAGSVVVRMREGAGDGLRVEVADTGCGVPAEEQQRIFLPYEQAETVAGGTGLGLAICAEAIRRMGGRIGVVSAPGMGSTFWFEAPLPVEAPVTPAAAAAVVCGGGGVARVRTGLLH